MKIIVKVNGEDLVFDSDQVPIMLVLEETDKELIASMSTNEKRYTTFPEGADVNEIRRWVNRGTSLCS